MIYTLLKLTEIMKTQKIKDLEPFFDSKGSISLYGNDFKMQG